MVMAFIAVTGEVRLKGKEHEFTLKAPPGPAMLVLDGLTDMEPRIETMEKVPDWVDKQDAELVKKVKAGVKLFRGLAEQSSIGEALLKMAQSDDEAVRRTAMILLGALDDLTEFATAMSTTQHQDVVENGIIVLRHWIGRGPGQDLKLYNALLEKQFKPAEAEIVLQLLHSFGPGDLRKPETYEALVAYLDSDRMAIRTLAHWHLVRLVPAGRKIDFSPTAPKESRDKAVEEWKKLIPAGTVPRPGKRRNSNLTPQFMA